MPLFYVKIRKNIDICNYLPIYYPAICRGWGTFSVPSQGAGGIPAEFKDVGVLLLPLGEGWDGSSMVVLLPLGEGWDGAYLPLATL